MSKSSIKSCKDYLHKGISSRNFVRTFTLNPDVVVNGAKLVNGMLVVELEHVIPEEKQPRKIAINQSKGKKSKKTLLTE